MRLELPPDWSYGRRTPAKPIPLLCGRYDTRTALPSATPSRLLRILRRMERRDFHKNEGSPHEVSALWWRAEARC